MLAAESVSSHNWNKVTSSFHTHRHPPVTPSAFAPPGMSPATNGHAPGSNHGASNGASSGSDAPRQDNNIMNIRGDMTSSLYQICLSLRRRLSHVPGFHQYLAEMEEEEAEADGATDPVTTMWNCLRRGYPLMTIYNAFQPHNPLNVDANRVAEKSVGKAATFKFLQACLIDLKIPPHECFLITDLYGVDTTGFVKVTKVVNRVLDRLDERGLLLPSDPRFADVDEKPGPGSQITHIQHVVREIVQSERTYVQHLEVLQQAKNEIEAGGNVPGDSIHDIFLNLNALLDFQRRFLIRIEQQNSLPESQQNWGQLFIQYKDSFRVYEPFIANQTRCNETVTREWDKIGATPHSRNLDDLFSSQSIFHAFCVKPFQRLSKYPLLLGQLGHKSQLDAQRKADLVEGEAAANSLMQRANEAVAKEQRTTAVVDLQLRVEDWKGHNMKQFGELLLYGNFTVVKGEGAKPAEREVGVIFDTFPSAVQCYVRYAVGQHRSGAATSLVHAQTNKAVGDDEESSVASPKTPQRIFSQTGQMFRRDSSELSTEVAPATPFRVNSNESLHQRTPIPSSPSLKSPLFVQNFLAKFKKAKQQDSSSLNSFLPQFFFNSPMTAVLLQDDAEDVKRRLNAVETSKPSQWDKHTSYFTPIEKECIVEKQLVNPIREQYIIYLFERILLCCKEVNPNKQRPKMLRNEKTPLNLHGKVRLQLKGRIFMQNVTDVLSFVRTEKSSYTIQIFWKGDPGVENFVIRFSNESEMNKWRDQVQQQKQILGESGRTSGQTGTSETMFTSMKNQSQLENPYLQNEDHEDEDESAYSQSDGMNMSAMSRNASSNSLRTTASQASNLVGRGLPLRHHYPEFSGVPPPLSLNTSVPPGPNTPGEFPGNSYFSPAADSPSSTRSSSQAATYPFPRQTTPVNHWPHEDSKHKTAPAINGPASRDSPGASNTYQINGRTFMRPSLPAMPPSKAAEAAQQLQRMRSASTPNIHDPPATHTNGSGPRRYANGQLQPTIDNIPVPPIPSHMAHMRVPPNRSQTNSPTNGMPPTRSATQSPMFPRDRSAQHAEQSVYNQTSAHRHGASQADQRLHMQGGYGPAPITVLRSPPMPMHTTSENEIPLPSQLKVKIWFQPTPSHVTIVVPIVIKHRSLIDRIDSKMVKISSASISKGTARLRYKDMDDDFVTISSDEDVQLAIEDWGQVNEEDLRNGDVRDFELYWEEKRE
ncbi:MAG: hypothetical protein LQ343_003435 [Gyalolechia ehrenbergii]|nr:MAG: hypothetical protein LQ343_003435 [Gyalolechia ehrenbergii]